MISKRICILYNPVFPFSIPVFTHNLVQGLGELFDPRSKDKSEKKYLTLKSSGKIFCKISWCIYGQKKSMIG